MRPSQEQVEAVIGSLSGWLSRPNVVALHVGRKTVGGRETEPLAIVVHVEKKGSADGFAIPREVTLTLHDHAGHACEATIPTDVIEVGESRLSLGGLGAVANLYKRPCPGGYQIQEAASGGTGTLGVNIHVPWVGAYCLLSCNHVISGNGRNKEVYQPNDASEEYWIADVDGYTRVVTYPDRCHRHPRFNRHDLAWCRVDADRASPFIHHLSAAPAGFRAARNGEEITAVGYRSDAPQAARVASRAALLKTRWSNHEWAWFSHVIMLDGVITRGGDSGAVYLGSDEGGSLRVVGMHVGATELYSWGCAFPAQRRGRTPAA